ncbi:helix-turn-helix transcriptional regulator [Halegenticoccus soli]|uniref:helix-turn-helix transcriptional regulator n=1 Tax=Halegenticoccus soli TaxID=1985678 RepID=UPI000C6CE0C9|nr:MarR family transcriptional regulator [Halegenticoccus soli]
MTALDDVAFLARSPRRVRVLETLIEGPHTRADLQEATGVPRATVGRIVTELEARGLVTSHGVDYRASPLGELLAGEFLSLVETAETVDKLRPVIEWLPVEEFDFSLEHFADATITFLKQSDTTAPVERAAALVENGDCVRILAFGSAPQVIEAAWRTTVHGTQSLEIIFAASTLAELLADSELESGRWLRDLARCERGAVFRYDGVVPYNIAVIDDTVGFALVDEYGAPSALIETEDEAIYAWAESTINTYRHEAEPLDPDELPS